MHLLCLIIFPPNILISYDKTITCRSYPLTSKLLLNSCCSIDHEIRAWFSTTSTIWVYVVWMIFSCLFFHFPGPILHCFMDHMAKFDSNFEIKCSNFKFDSNSCKIYPQFGCNVVRRIFFLTFFLIPGPILHCFMDRMAKFDPNSYKKYQKRLLRESFGQCS